MDGKKRKVGTLIEWKRKVELGPPPLASSIAATDQALMAYSAAETAEEDGSDPVLDAAADDLAPLPV